jgi:hypothetical protein
VSVSRPEEARQLDLFEIIPEELVQRLKYGSRTRVVRSTFECETCRGTFPKVGRRNRVCVECYKKVPCSADGCHTPRRPGGPHCDLHRWRMRQYGSLELPEKPKCSLGHCDEPAGCKGLCIAHYDRKRKGTPDWDRPLGQCAHPGCTDQAGKKRRYCRPHTSVRRRESSRRLYRENPEKSAVRRKAYYAEHAERLKEMNRQWYADNPGYSAEKHRRWRKQNPERSQSIDAKKRAARNKQIAETQVELIDYREIIAEYGMWCHICDTAIESRDDLHIDHVIPLSRGGSHTKDNLKPSHALCNLKKGAKVA